LSTERTIERVVPAVPSADVPGLALTRMIATPHLDMLDPFLLLSDFEPAVAGQPVGGFGDHPHRGFETVTYMLAGEMHHRDHTGTAGVIGPGGVQWMTAGRGIIHAETPVPDENGALRGFQLWTNLPAAEKMREPGYQEFAADAVPEANLGAGSQVRVIAGTVGGVTGPVRGIGAQPTFLDITLEAGAAIAVPLAAPLNAFAYVADGALEIGGEAAASVPTRHLAVLTNGDSVKLRAGDGPCRLLLVAAEPLNEPVARYGPFVMNTREEIMQAFADFQNGRF